MNFSVSKWAIFGSLHGCYGNCTVAMYRLPRDTIYENLNTCFTGLNGILLNKILVAMENIEKMLGGPCSQHVTGNTPRLNQSQSVIIHS